MFKGLSFVSILLLASLSGAQELPILPLEALQAGMQGVGGTVFQGVQREEFTFVVRSVVPGSRGGTTRVIVGLTGCPNCSEGGTHMFEHTQIYGGMSGSYMHVVDPASGQRYIVGGLGFAPGFATTAKTLLTPIENQYGMAAHLPKIERPVRTPVEPGDYSATCLVYGDQDDSDWCFYGTITARHEGRLYLMSHGVSYDSETAFPYDGDTDLPVFQVPVADILQSQQSPTKMAGKRIAPVGSAVVHGPYGFVVEEGKRSKTVPVSMTINGVYKEPLTLMYHMAYHKLAPSALMDLLYSEIQNLPGKFEGSSAEVTVRLNKPAFVLYYTDSFGTGASSLRYLLRLLIEQEKKGLDVEGVTISYTPIKKMDYWAPVKFVVDHKDGKDLLSVFARRGYDNEMEQVTEPADVGELSKYRQGRFLFKEFRKKRVIDWWDGATLHDFILQRIPVRAALGLLDQIQDREALYLVYGELDSELKASGSADRKQHLPEIRILLRPKFSGYHFFLPADKNGTRTAVEFVEY